MKFTLPDRCKKAIVENADLILKRQVTKIEVRWDQRRKEMVYYSCPTKKMEKKEQLTKSWLYENFSTTLPGFYEQLISTTMTTTKQFKVPPGQPKCTSPWILTFDKNSPNIQFRQNGEHTCIFSSVASALHYGGLIDYANHIHKHKILSLKENNPFTYLQNIIRGKPRLYNPINVGRKGITWEELNPNVIYVATLINVTKDCLHGISIYKGFIFDSNLESAIQLSKDNLDWCSHSPNNNVEYSEFAGFRRIIELNPIPERGTKRSIHEISKTG